MADDVRDLSPRMRLLLDSAVEVVARHGLRGLTHRAVDREAGLPEGSCSSYLRTRLALLTALAEHVSASISADVERVSDSLDTAQFDVDAAVAATGALVEHWVATPQLVMVRHELALESVRRPELRSTFDPWRESLLDVVERVVARVLDTSGPAARARAQAVVAAIEGILLTALTIPDERRGDYTEETVRLVLASLALEAGVD